MRTARVTQVLHSTPSAGVVVPSVPTTGATYTTEGESKCFALFGLLFIYQFKTIVLIYKP